MKPDWKPELGYLVKYCSRPCWLPADALSNLDIVRCDSTPDVRRHDLVIQERPVAWHVRNPSPTFVSRLPAYDQPPLSEAQGSGRITAEVCAPLTYHIKPAAAHPFPEIT